MANHSDGRTRHPAVWLTLGLIGLLVAWWIRERDSGADLASAEAALPAVSLAPPADTASRITALGRLQPRDGVRTISGPAQAVAVVGRLFVDKGDRVRAGQLLAQLDDAELRAARVQRAEVRLANAEAELERHEKLRADRVISDSLRDKLKLDHDVAIADLRLARAELARVEVRSPIDGQVLTVHARAGERVGSEGLLELGETGAMYAIAEVYEADVGRVALGSRALVTSRSLPRPLHGVVDEIALRVRKQDVLGNDPAARTDARVVEVEVRLDEADVPAAAGLTHLQVEIAIEAKAD
ncbi:efflux RND transporter periplasmic adaptor subunit [Myxococcota bacterium]|nr:efflux RND transporter periplasmic adaptor subunit [Myxococcota bacterium]